MTKRNKILTVAGSVLFVIIVCAVTVFIIGQIRTENKPRESDSTSQQQEDPEKSIKEAGEHEAKGETEAAIEDYKKAMENFKKANNEAGAEAARMQIEYLENLPSEPLVDTPDPQPMIRGQEHLYD